MPIESTSPTQGLSLPVEVWFRKKRRDSKAKPYLVCEGCKGSVIDMLYEDQKTQTTWHEECYTWNHDDKKSKKSDDQVEEDLGQASIR